MVTLTVICVKILETRPKPLCHQTNAIYNLEYFSFYRPFPTEESVDDEDVYKGLPDLIEYVINNLVK